MGCDHLVDECGHTGFQHVVFDDAPSPNNGVFTVPDAPGLGLSLNEEELDKRIIPWEK
ncbi:MAG: hypothetical protein ACLFVU_12385 [Phycisphaerae bacterium]